MKYVVIRKPCIMEDQGCYTFCALFDSAREAEEYIRKNKGYFGRAAFLVTKEGDMFR